MSDLISRIYDCAMQPQLWPEVLQEIAETAGAFGAMLFDCEWRGPQEMVSLRYCSTIYDPALVGWYVETHNEHEVRDQGRFAMLSSTGDEVNLIRCDDLYASRAELESKPNVVSMMDFGVHYRAGALLSKDTAAMDRFALQFRAHQGPIAEPARLLVQGLLPHVAKALSIGRALQRGEGEKRALAQTLEAIPFGIGIIKGTGEVLYANTEFGVLADAYRLAQNGMVAQLRVQALPENMQLLLQSVTRHGRFGARPLREAAYMAGRIEGTGLFIEASPINDHPEMDRFGPDTFLISMLDSQRAHAINPEIVRRFFPLTESEMSVLELVVKGHTNGEIADIRGRSLETVNSQMKSLIRKSGTRNRTELVRVAVSLSVASLNQPKAG